MSVFATVRRIIGKQLGFISDPPPAPRVPHDPRIQKAIALLSADPSISDRDLAIALGFSTPEHGGAYRLVAERYLQQMQQTPSPPTAQTTGPLEAQVTTIRIPTVGTLSLQDTDAEVLRQRRNALLANIRVGQRPHTKLMNFLNSCWVVVAPLLFVLLTVGEVAYVLYQARPKESEWVLVNPLTLIVAGAIFIDVSMMFTTWRLAARREDEAQAESSGQEVPPALKKDIQGLTRLWLIFAAINVACQIAFLVNFIDQHNGWLIGVVVLRVIGFISSDYSVAFHLSRVEPEYREVLRTEREIMNADTEFTKLDGERLIQQAENNARIRGILDDVKRREADTDFLNALHEGLYHDILDKRQQLPQPKEDQNQPPPTMP